MSLSDYTVSGPDFFQPREARGGALVFPCCACVFASRSASENPCNVCWHNVNSQPQMETGKDGAM